MINALPISMKDLDDRLVTIQNSITGRPDYSKPTAISGKTYTVPDNGYIQCYVALYKSGEIKINNLVVFKFYECFTENSGDGGCAVIPVSKGDVLTISGTYTQLNFLPYK